MGYDRSVLRLFNDVILTSDIIHTHTHTHIEGDKVTFWPVMGQYLEDDGLSLHQSTN